MEITIDMETEKQWNKVIAAAEKQKVAKWAAEQSIQIDNTYRPDRSPYLCHFCHFCHVLKEGL